MVLSAVARNLIQAQTLQKVQARGIQKHMSGTVMFGKPGNTYYKGTKGKIVDIAHNLFFVCGVFAVPAWVLTHIEEYRGGRVEE